MTRLAEDTAICRTVSMVLVMNPEFRIQRVHRAKSKVKLDVCEPGLLSQQKHEASGSVQFLLSRGSQFDKESDPRDFHLPLVVLLDHPPPCRRILNLPSYKMLDGEKWQQRLTNNILSRNQRPKIVKSLALCPTSHLHFTRRAEQSHSSHSSQPSFLHSRGGLCPKQCSTTLFRQSVG